ncbi:MAG: hypothetical protein HRT61_22040 [Ekhidna sp.]|nr:hypothetical protein [Ekhidna sp.]
MDILKKLSPAEAKLILEPDCKVSELLKFTFMDLLMRQILRTKLADEVVKYHQISTGSEFQSFKLKKHEELFTKGFAKDSEMVLSLFEVKKLIQTKFKNPKDLKWSYFIEPNLSEYFKQLPTGLVRRFVKIKLNSNGESLKEELTDVFKDLDDQFSGELTKEKISAIYSLIGTNVILIKGYDSKELTELFEADKKEKRQYDTIPYPIDSTVYYSDSSESSNESEAPTFPIFDPNIIHEILESIESAAESISETFSSTFDSSSDSSSWSGDGSGGGFFGGGFFSGDSGWGDSGGDSGCSSGCGGCGGGD